MQTSLQDDLASLRSKTKVVTDGTFYHARTPAGEPWCSSEPREGSPLGKHWELIGLLTAERQQMIPCRFCFTLSPAVFAIEDELKYDDD